MALAAGSPDYLQGLQLPIDAQEPLKPLSQHDRNRPIIFSISFKENAKEGDTWWSVTGEARYALLPAWDLQRQPPGSAEELYEKRGGFTGLKPGEIVQFYAKEFKSQGGAALGDEKYSWSETVKDGVQQINECGETGTYTEKYADVSEATLRRTENGAVLSFNWKLNTYCLLGYSASILGFTDEEARQILTFELTEEDLRNFGKLRRTNNGTIHGEGKDPSYSVTLSAALNLEIPPPDEIEVNVYPLEDYEEWMPEGNLKDPSQPGNKLRLRANVKRGEAKLRFEFKEVSREEGVCLNWPARGADKKPDLRLRFNDAALGSPSEDGTSIETKGLVKEAELIVDAYDFGAWGTLRITAKDKDQRDAVVKILDRRTHDLKIPLDEDANRIADAWKPLIAKNRRGDVDDEHQDGNENDGDGLTLYEEYRGFAENLGQDNDWKVKQGDPESKDFFVLNLVGREALKGLYLFKTVTKLNVHSEFSRTELDPKTRVINRYSSAGSRQHGIVIEWWDEDPGYSEAVPKVGTPIDVSAVKLSRKKLDNPEGKTVRDTDYSPGDLEVAHELAHTVNVYHHGEGDLEDVEWGWETGEIRENGEKTVRVFLEDGQELTLAQVALIVRTAEGKVWLGRQGGQHSGNEECLMRYAYNGLLAYQDRRAPEAQRFIADPQQPGVKLCRSPDGTGVNDAERSNPQPAWGDASPGRGNCFGQIRVKDRLQSKP